MRTQRYRKCLKAGYDDIYEHLNKRNNLVYDGFDFPVFTFNINITMTRYCYTNTLSVYTHLYRQHGYREISTRTHIITITQMV